MCNIMIHLCGSCVSNTLGIDQRISLCKVCQPLFPFNHIQDDHEFKNTLISFFQQEDICMTDFEDIDIFSSGTLAGESFCCEDNFFDNNPCKFYSVNSFNSYIEHNTRTENGLVNISLFHLNAQSLYKNFSNCLDFINSLAYKFSIYGFCETWFNETPHTYFTIPEYNFIHKSRHSRKGGGVCIYICTDINYKIREDLDFSSDKYDTLFIEIPTPSKNTIVGIVYKAPDCKPEEFFTSFEKCLDTINCERKSCYIMGDFNFNLLKCQQGPPQVFINTLLSH